MQACGLVHRDLKLANILLAADGPRVIDFGISRPLEGTAVTASNVVVGTPSFMSPEQVQALLVGFASDVFALGSVITFAATGVAPFGSGDLAAVAYRIVHVQPDLSGMSTALRNLVANCLVKVPADRPSLTRLLEIVMAESGFYPSVYPANFWPEPVARLISLLQDTFGNQISPHAAGGPAAAVPSVLHESAAPAGAEFSGDSGEATRTAVSFPGIRTRPTRPLAVTPPWIGDTGPGNAIVPSPIRIVAVDTFGHIRSQSIPPDGKKFSGWADRGAPAGEEVTALACCLPTDASVGVVAVAGGTVYGTSLGGKLGMVPLSGAMGSCGAQAQVR